MRPVKTLDSVVLAKNEQDFLTVKFPGLAIPNDKPVYMSDEDETKDKKLKQSASPVEQKVKKLEDKVVDDAMAELEALAPSFSSNLSKEKPDEKKIKRDKRERSKSHEQIDRKDRKRHFSPDRRRDRHCSRDRSRDIKNRRDRSKDRRRSRSRERRRSGDRRNKSRSRDRRRRSRSRSRNRDRRRDNKERDRERRDDKERDMERRDDKERERKNKRESPDIEEDPDPGKVNIK